MKEIKETMLISYFHMENILPLNHHKLGLNDDRQLYPAANALAYQDFPTIYSYNNTDKIWSRRRRPHKTNAVGRMFTTSPTAGELLYHRILLTKRSGCTSFSFLRTINNIEYNSFKETCN